MKIYYNGFKAEGQPLFKGSFSFGMGQEGDNSITFYAESYLKPSREVYAALKTAGLTVDNETDAMIDYFDKDRITIQPDHPLYKEAARAVIQKEERHIKRMESRKAKADSKKIFWIDDSIGGSKRRIKNLKEIAQC